MDQAQMDAIRTLAANHVKESLTYLRERIPELAFAPSGQKLLRAVASIGPDLQLSTTVSKDVLLNPREARNFFASWQTRREEFIAKMIAYETVDRVLFGEL